MDSRTPEQVSADEKLREALNEVVRVNEMVEGNVVLTQYMVLMVHQGFERDGRGNSEYNYIMSDDGMPWHHAFGLLYVARSMLDKQAAEGGGDDQAV